MIVHHQGEDCACWTALREAVMFTPAPGVREKGHHLHALVPDETLPNVEQVLENRKSLGEIPGD
jgi:hypothetical protein